MDQGFFNSSHLVDGTFDLLAQLNNVLEKLDKCDHSEGYGNWIH
jgi:hypothetical protein